MKKEEKKTFEITVERFFRHIEYTMGRMIIEGKVFCNTCEDTDRNLYQGMDIETIRERKVYGKTCIPRGRYKIDMETVSSKFSRKKFFKDLCQGKLPRLLEVPGFENILIHTGTTQDDTAGCILVGMNTEKGKVYKSQDTFKKLYAILKEHHNNGEEIWITIK